MKRPSFQFYPGDWLQDVSLRLCSVGARGIWMDMLCLMHQGSPYGHLKVKDKAITIPQLARTCGCSLDEANTWIAELIEAGACRTNDEGVIYSKRMVEDERLRSIRAAGGKEGGNPKLIAGYNKPGFLYAMRRLSDGHIKIGISQHPEKRIYKVRQQYPGDTITLLAKKFVDDMGYSEGATHAVFARKKSGEWFALDEGECRVLLEVHLKENYKVSGKVNPTPSSPTSSPSPPSINTEEAPAPIGAPPLTPPPPPPKPPVDKTLEKAEKKAEAPTPPPPAPPQAPVPSPAPAGRNLFGGDDDGPKMRAKPKGAETFERPDYIPEGIWTEFLAYRFEMAKTNRKAPFTAAAMKGCIGYIDKCIATGETAESSLLRCMANGWRVPYIDNDRQAAGGRARPNYGYTQRVNTRERDAERAAELAGLNDGPPEGQKNENSKRDFVDVEWRDASGDGPKTGE